MLNLILGSGILLFIVGCALLVTGSENIGMTLVIFGFIVSSLFAGLSAWFGEQEPYVKLHKLMAIIWVCYLSSYIPDFLLAPGLISPWFIYSPYILLLIAYIYMRQYKNQHEN